MMTIIQQSHCPYCGHAMPPPSTELLAMLSKPIHTHEWSTRVVNIFDNFTTHRWDGKTTTHIDAPIKTFADLCAMSEAELLRAPNFGRRSLAEVKDALAGYGLQLTTVRGWGDNEIRTNPCLEEPRP